MSERKDDGGPAFPFKCQGPTTAPETYYGMSLRDWFAGMAMQAQVSQDIYRNPFSDADMSYIATMSYGFADAMLKARNK